MIGSLMEGGIKARGHAGNGTAAAQVPKITLVTIQLLDEVFSRRRGTMGKKGKPEHSIREKEKRNLTENHW